MRKMDEPLFQEAFPVDNLRGNVSDASFAVPLRQHVLGHAPHVEEPLVPALDHPVRVRRPPVRAAGRRRARRSRYRDDRAEERDLYQVHLVHADSRFFEFDYDNQYHVICKMNIK